MKQENNKNQVDSSLADTLLDEKIRRFNGVYYTPKIWADKSHEMITKTLGDNWREKYVVWDNAAGTKNLTRDYKFKNLYSSTINEEELLITQHLNKENINFQYDFLNDDICLHDGTYTLEDLKNMSDEELDKSLKLDITLVKKLLNKEPIIFFTNPPYGQAGTGGFKENKAGISKNNISNLMKKEKNGYASAELCTQFIYRIKLLADFFEYDESDSFHIFLFGMDFMSGPGFINFMNNFTSEFSFHNGFIFNASEFKQTTTYWSVIFSHWSLKGNKNQIEFPFDILEKDKNNNIIKIGNWISKISFKDELISDWLRDIPVNKEIKRKIPLTTDGFKSSKNIINKNFFYDNSFGLLQYSGSNIRQSDVKLALYTQGISSNRGIYITNKNFIRVLITFSIRRTISEKLKKEKSYWYRVKDNIKRPSNELLTDKFIADCVIYSLFDSQSIQTSLRDFEYNGIKYRVNNEFFPFSIKFIKELAIKNNNTDILNDLKDDHERIIYRWIEEHYDDLSEEALKLLEKIKELYEITFKYREEYYNLIPEYQLNTWDAGYRQIARLSFGRKRINDDFIEFKKELYDIRYKLGEKIATEALNNNII